MKKTEIVTYLTGLLTLMEAQDTSGVHNRSQVLGDEYHKHWDLLKSMIEQEQADETRKRDVIGDGRNKARYADEEREPSRGFPDRPGSTNPPGADHHGQGSTGPSDEKR